MKLFNKSYKLYALVTRKSGYKELLPLCHNRLDYAEYVYDNVEKARRKSRPKYKKKKFEDINRWTPKWTVWEKDPSDHLTKEWLDKWYELQRKLIFATAKKEYYWVGTGDDMFTVHKNYVEIIKK